MNARKKHSRRNKPLLFSFPRIRIGFGSVALLPAGVLGCSVRERKKKGHIYLSILFFPPSSGSDSQSAICNRVSYALPRFTNKRHPPCIYIYYIYTYIHTSVSSCDVCWTPSFSPAAVRWSFVQCIKHYGATRFSLGCKGRDDRRQPFFSRDQTASRSNIEMLSKAVF